MAGCGDPASCPRAAECCVDSDERTDSAACAEALSWADLAGRGVPTRWPVGVGSDFAVGSRRASNPAGAVDGGSAVGVPLMRARVAADVPVRRAAMRRTKPLPGTMPARRSVRGSSCIGKAASAPTVIRRTGSRTISSTQVNARAPDSRRVPSAPWISALTCPRSRMTVPSAVGAMTPNGGGSELPAKTTEASRCAIAAPGWRVSATASIAPSIRSVEGVSPARYTTTAPKRAIRPSPGAIPTVDASFRTRASFPDHYRRPA